MDDLGGIDSAIQKARELAGIPSSSRVSLVLYPAKKSLLGGKRVKLIAIIAGVMVLRSRGFRNVTGDDHHLISDLAA